jgi:hypothetical protein
MTSKSDLRRSRHLVDYGCCACKQLGFYSVPEIHHVLSGGRRQSNSHTIPLCPWHHRGIIPAETFLDIGPSLANGSKPFHARFGSEEDMLKEIDHEILDLVS